ncbi:hypothetical protein, partial [Citrobacter freundii]
LPLSDVSLIRNTLSRPPHTALEMLILMVVTKLYVIRKTSIYLPEFSYVAKLYYSKSEGVSDDI